ncbi:MAG: hypothetical protein B7X53_07960 [Hyphomonas sp. 34-62-18]|nr:MAG: hypothetical protein B7X53_07960 [Hyphomonas sp. 34-62-18]
MEVGLLQQGQHASMALLLCELHAFYNPGAEVSPDVTLDHLTQRLLDPASGHTIVVAADGEGTVLGLAAYSFLYSLVHPSPEHRLQCMMKELFVSRNARSGGIGKALMNQVIAQARAAGCGRMDWHVAEANAAGIRFYESLGAEKVPGRLCYRLPLR